MTAQETNGPQQMRPVVGAMSAEGGAEVGRDSGSKLNSQV